MKTSRQVAFDTLLSVFQKKAYSNIALNQSLTEAKLAERDKGFASALFYGVLERKLTLDHILTHYLTKPIGKLDKEILIVLEMGVYQLLYLDSVPDSSAVDESVKLTAYARKASAKGFVNAVLRGFLRDNKAIALPDSKKSPAAYYSVNYACPQWLFEQWESQYDRETAIALAEASLNRPPLAVRVNTLKTTAEKLMGYLENRGVKASAHPWLADCLLLEDTGSIEKLAQFKQGLFHVQDAASQLCAKMLGAKAGDTVLDICAAPGSKSFTIAQQMENQGEIHAFDLYDHKLKLMQEGAKRLGISILHTALQDGAVHNDDIPAADCVLCDVPCSGLGIIRRKPEIKYKNPAEFGGLPDLQYKILQNAASYVKSGGRLVYSTCTTNKKENEDVIFKFLSQNNFFKPLQLPSDFSKIENKGNFMATLMPHKNACDGFFIAVLQNVGDLQHIADLQHDGEVDG